MRALQFLPGDHGVAYNVWMIIFVGITYFLPVILWLPKAWRRNLWIMSAACISVNVGMWLERYLLFVPARPTSNSRPSPGTTTCRSGRKP